MTNREVTAPTMDTAVRSFKHRQRQALRRKFGGSTHADRYLRCGYGRRPRRFDEPPCLDLGCLEMFDPPQVLVDDELPHVKGITDPPPEALPYGGAVARFFTPFGDPLWDTAGDPAVLKWERTRDEHKRVGLSRLFYRGTRLTVSTVHLGLDHGFLPVGPPVIFETMVFYGNARLSVWGVADGHQWRYCTRSAALAGHRGLVAAIRAELNGKRASDWGRRLRCAAD